MLAFPTSNNTSLTSQRHLKHGIIPPQFASRFLFLYWKGVARRARSCSIIYTTHKAQRKYKISRNYQLSVIRDADSLQHLMREIPGAIAAGAAHKRPDNALPGDQKGGDVLPGSASCLVRGGARCRAAAGRR